MERIASFCINHNKLQPGIYLSRVDGDVVTYDLRFKVPNQPPFLENAALHTIEHLFATCARNSPLAEHVIYFGPMGCRTGFYFLVRGLPHARAIELIRQCVAFTASFTGEIPGSTAAECGNYREHDLAGAKAEAAAYLKVIADWDENMLGYTQ